MKVPISWLKEYVEFDASPDELAKRFTFSGIEVEGIENGAPSYDGVVVGEVLSIEKHPGADRLLICRVNDGAGEQKVVCGAHNFAVGDKAPFARVGAVLPNGLKISERKVRGELSCGMLCAEDELQISEDHSGIMLLDRSLAVGTPFSKAVKTEEIVLELEVTWNRPDCLCIIGIARELAALFGTKLKFPSVEFPEKGEQIEKLAKVTVEDSVGCPRYTARVISGVKTGASPVWMQKRLMLSGVRPISNIVDITNYVMLECGQPLHAFDYSLLANHEIVVRRAKLGETMATLDGIERNITPEMLLIADAARPIALAGVMGGAGSEIQDNTGTVLLESAAFDPRSIRQTSSKLGFTTESSYRFERSVDIRGVDWASRRAASLIVQYCGGTAAAGSIDVFPKKLQERNIACRFQRVNDLLGVSVPAGRVVSIFESLQIPVVKLDDSSCTIAAPSFRPDLMIEADLIEEVARINGLDQIPAVPPPASVIPDADDSRTRAIIALRTSLVGLGLSETMNYSFVSERLLNIFSPQDVGRRVALPNPVSADYAIMRDSLIPQMVEWLGRNLFHQIAEVSFFEIGKVFLKGPDGKIREEDRLSIGLLGKVGRSSLDSRRGLKRDEMFLWAKGIVEALHRAQHLNGVESAPCRASYFEEGGCVSISVGGQQCGIMGLVAEPIRKEWRMTEPVAVVELALDPLLSRFAAAPALKPAPVYPSIARDVAIIVAKEITHEDILHVIRRSAPGELTETKLFDIFTGDAIGVGRKSLAYSLVYCDLNRTLTDEDANRYHNAIKDALKNELKAEIREN
jgi:phenylalanyl-tRNA synthetase beta chain